jgi:hypothetical protein
MPQGSFNVMMSGGESHPVAQGEIARAIHPEGAIKNASPKAAEAWGRASRGAKSLSNRPMLRGSAPKISPTSAKDISVAPKPGPKDSRQARASPGQSNSADRLVAPWPKVMSNPKPTGKTKNARKIRGASFMRGYGATP